MRKFLWLLLLASQAAMAQHQITALVQDAKTHLPLAGVSVFIKDSGQMGITDANGVVTLFNLPSNKFKITFSELNYIAQTIDFEASQFPEKDTLKVFLIPKDNEMQEVIVTSTRTNSRIEDNPIRVEVIGQEEVSEEGVIKPMGIAKLLTESGSVLPQQTSSISGNVSIRLQGLDGKYTQVLKDGFPLYSGFSQGLSIVQIPPLDLKQIELIKGSSSSLYGGDAIAGIINLISKQPQPQHELTFLLNGTSLGGQDANLYYSKRWKKLGFSFLSANSWQKAKDINQDGFTELPKTQTFNVSPTLYYYPNPNTSIRLGLNGTFDKRIGGDILALNRQPNNQHSYFEQNITHRLSSQLMVNHHFNTNTQLTLKNSESYFKRSIHQATTAFVGDQWNSYSEISLFHKTHQHTIVAGINLNTENFKEDTSLSHLSRNLRYVTLGVFLQDDWKLTKNLIAEIGLRNDFQNQFGLFFLPRLSLRYQVEPDFYIRAGSGLGYKLPTIFSASAEELGINLVQPLPQNIKAEQSISANIDFNYKVDLDDEASLTFNQSFFTTRIHQPLVLQQDTYLNESLPIITSGFESDIKFREDAFQIIGAYTFINAKRTYDYNQSFIPLTPKHKANLDVIYEIEGKYSFTAEGFYLSSMYRDQDVKTPSFFTLGLSLQKYFKHFSLIGNLENVLDVRQSRQETLVIPPFNDPSFRQIYAPLEGRIFNLALKINL
ncbi:MAG: TonB-dependent receptor [Bacteroidetes bacterium]|nr:TonB-dependent receptor [Bacteroidota bacterium]MBU1373377.1 TonB-dependent receptor [Bacteroidota bacterium]MBU1485647.1 TonB-dependent receptor [Bacteroidota bacterium]MBU1762009.1 TonB-dependent receptor [Bacteroidota bacterium]MBU2266606.1 TonB-dependent receptor [Bacteroidota bacterium]